MVHVCQHNHTYLRIVLSIYAQHTVCQPIQFYQHRCRYNHPPILYTRDIGKQSDVVTRGWGSRFYADEMGWVMRFWATAFSNTTPHLPAYTY